MILIRCDPSRDLDRLTSRMFASMSCPVAMPMDAYRDRRATHRPVRSQALPGDGPDSEQIDARDDASIRTPRFPVAPQAGHGASSPTAPARRWRSMPDQQRNDA